jgi:GT2 family glycosyltransferase
LFAPQSKVIRLDPGQGHHLSGLPFVSVIIVNYNGLRFAEACLRSVLDTDYPNFEVVVVDNGSTDGSYEVLRRSYGFDPRVKLIPNYRNLGYAQANNVGYRNSVGEVIVFLNIDTEVDHRWLAELVRALLSSKSVGGAQSKLMSLADREFIQSIGHCVDRLGFVYPRVFYQSGSDDAQELFYAEGASMGFKRSVIESVSLDGNPFDPDYFFYYEDNDLCWRVRLNGHGIIFVPSSIVYHLGGGCVPSTFRYRATFSFTKNKISTLIKNYSLGNLLCIVPPVLFLEFVRSVTLLPRHPLDALARMGALVWTALNLRGIWRKRVFVQNRIRVIQDSQIVRYMVRVDLSMARRLETGYSFPAKYWQKNRRCEPSSIDQEG